MELGDNTGIRKPHGAKHLTSLYALISGHYAFSFRWYDRVLSIAGCYS
jgi:hypothetical protein